MKRTIAIVAGGDSSEYHVSLRSAEGLTSFMDKERYELWTVVIHGTDWHACLPDGGQAPIDRNDFSFRYDGRHVCFDYAYITIHGTPGENGLLESYFELIRLPYSTCTPLISAMTFNKFVLNQYLRGFGVRVAESLTLKKGRSVSDDDIIDRIGLPCFVKPTCGGSSFGTTKVKTRAELQPAIAEALKEADEVMVEAFMQGTEITCGCYKTRKNSVVFPITEVVSEDEFFDYDAKYNGRVSEITPARIPEDTAERVRKLTSAIYDILSCRGIIRIDYIITEGETLNLLEINTTPGMTATSFIPQQVRAAGLEIKDVLTDIIEDSFN
jgi:D-alanine-D-alanine ligase